MRVTVFNTAHFEIKVGQYKFPPFKETQISIGPVQSALRDMRCYKALRIDRIDNKQFIKELGLIHMVIRLIFVMIFKINMQEPHTNM